MSTPRSSVIEGARAAVASRLRTLSFLDPAAVIEHKAGNTETAFNEALAKTELVVIVGIMQASESESQSPRIEWRPIRLFVDVFESAMHQLGTPQPPGAWAVAEELVAALKLVSISDVTFPYLAQDPLKELPTAADGALCVRFLLELQIAGNSRSTT